MRRALLVAAALAAADAGCARQSGLEVTLTGPIASIGRIELTVTLGAEVDLLIYPRGGGAGGIALPQTVGIRFPGGPSGSVSVEARALDVTGALLGEGSGTAVLFQGLTVDLVIAMDAVAMVVCGNGVVEPPETCEDGNALPDDGCFDCELECGDGVAGALEVCDDGNRLDGDACSADCQEAFAFIETVSGGPGASPDGAAAATTQLIGPRGIAVSPDGEPCWAEAYRIRCMSGGIVTTLAGRGTSGWTGDGGPAVEAELWSPLQLAWDPAGNLYFTDGYYHAVRRVDAATGEIELFAGSPSEADQVDGARLDARFSRPYGFAADAAGNLYVSELLGHTIRRIDPAGNVTTIAGSPGAPGSSGNGGPATGALLDGPGFLALDAAGASLYVSDTNNFQIRRIDLASGVISVSAGNGSSGAPLEGAAPLTQPLLSVGGLDVAADGTLRFVMGGQEVWRVAGGVLAREAFIAHASPCVAIGGGGDGGDPLAACIEAAGDLVTNGGEVLVTDSSEGKVRRYVPAGASSTLTLAGSPGPASANADPRAVKLYGPTGLGREGVDLIIADNVGARVLRAAGDTAVTTVAGNLTWGFSGDGGPAASATLSSPFGVAVHPMLGILVADLGNNRVRGISSGVITTVAGDGSTFFVSGSAPTATGVAAPSAVVDDGAGGFYVAEYSGGRILHVSLGAITLVAGGGLSAGDGPGPTVALSAPLGMALRADGKLLFVEGTRVRKYDPANQSVTTIAGLPTPTLVVVGPDVNGDGGLAAMATFRAPTDLAVGPDGMTIYVADAAAGAVRVFVEGDVISTLAGGDDDLVGYSRDGTRAAAAELATPWRLWSDPGTGQLYVAELGNHAVRRIVFP